MSSTVDTTQRRQGARPGAVRLAVLALIGFAVTITLLVLLDGGGSYTVHARFVDAGQMVKGGAVKVAGRKVGSIEEISLSPSGQADVNLSIKDERFTPLPVGTRASIRAVGQAGIANRFVDLAPGPAGGRTLADGAVLSTDQTQGIVNIDAILDSFGPRERSKLRQLMARSSQIYAGSGARDLNEMLRKLNPALAEVHGFSRELASDQEAIRQVVSDGNKAASAIAGRRTDLTAAVGNVAQSFGAVASQRQALADVLERAPEFLAQATQTLEGAGTSMTSLRPVLRDLPSSGRPLQTFLRRADTTLRTSPPVTAGLREQLPPLTHALAGLPALKTPAVRAMNSTAKGLKESRHILRGARIYGSDLILGILNGNMGVAAANFGPSGHYVRLEFAQPPQTFLAGLGSPLLSKEALIPGLFDIRTHLLRRCPGGNAPPAMDGSSPWVPDRALCDPSQSIPESVNEPGGLSK